MKRAVVIVGVLVAIAAGLWAAFVRHDREPTASTAIELRGGDGASMPVAPPLEQGLDPAALEAAGDTARALGASALLVARRGHRVFEWVAGGADRRIRSLLLSRLVLDGWAATRGADAIATPLPAGLDGAARVQDISATLWQPLAAAPALYEPDARGEPRFDCCLWLRPRDALALAAAVMGGGEVGGQHLFTPAAASRVIEALDDGIAPRGAEAFGARPARVLRDDEGTRLYFFPAQEIAILLAGADEARLADETALAHQVLRGVVDPSAPLPAAPSTKDLVPAH